MKHFALIFAAIVIQLNCVKSAPVPLSHTDAVSTQSCTFANFINFVEETPEQCSLCMEVSDAEYLLAGLTTLIVFLAAPAAVAYMMWMLCVVAAGPVAGGVVAWLMHMGASMWLISVLQAVGMGGLGNVGSALCAISFGSGVLLIMNGIGYSCAPFPCEYVPCNLV